MGFIKDKKEVEIKEERIFTEDEMLTTHFEIQKFREIYDSLNSHLRWLQVKRAIRINTIHTPDYLQSPENQKYANKKTGKVEVYTYSVILSGYKDYSHQLSMYSNWLSNFHSLKDFGIPNYEPKLTNPVVASSEPVEMEVQKPSTEVQIERRENQTNNLERELIRAREILDNESRVLPETPTV